MQLGLLKRKFQSELTGLYDDQEAKALSKNALMFALACSASDLLVRKNETVSVVEIEKALHILSRLKSFEPLQYIIGSTEFFGLNILVNKHVLIPRPETEELVEWIINDHKQLRRDTKISVLDIGTGSGCIAIALGKNLVNAELYALDVSKDALTTATLNSKNNNTNVKFSELDILKATVTDFKETFDCVVSNPPYISMHEKSSLHRNVIAHEPHEALFVEGKNPLLFYEKIGEIAIRGLLKTNGLLYFEVNEMFADETAEMLDDKGFQNIIVRNDISGRKRMIRCVNN